MYPHSVQKRSSKKNQELFETNNSTILVIAITVLETRSNVRIIYIEFFSYTKSSTRLSWKNLGNLKNVKSGNEKHSLW